MVFTDRGTGLTISQPTPSPISGTAGAIYRTQRLEVNIVHSACNDGMSDRSYPDTVQVYADGRLYRGCGGGGATRCAPGAWVRPRLPPPVAGPPVPPLDRTRWTVVAINDRPDTPREGEYSMEFDAGRAERPVRLQRHRRRLHADRLDHRRRRDHRHQDGLFRHELGEPRHGRPRRRSCRSMR